MRDRSQFFFKVSSEAQDFDFSKYSTKHSHRTPRSVFLSNDENIRARQNGEWLEIHIGTPSLFNACIKWHEPTSRLEVQTDRFGLQSVFYHDSGSAVYIAGKIDTLAKTLPSAELSPRAMAFYLMAGFLPPGWTFWQKINRVKQCSRWDLIQRKSTHEDSGAWEPRIRKPSISAPAMIEVLKESLSLIRGEIGPDEIRLSGGVDSRVVSYLWNAPIDAVVVKSPWMKSGEDLDVNLATRWAKLRNLPIRTFDPTDSTFAFFQEPTAKPMLTGLCGGEFLGGQFELEIPSQATNWDAVLAEHFPKSFGDIFRDDEWVVSVRRDSEKWRNEAARVYLQSARSTIYRSFSGSWAIPLELHTEVVSPFVTPAFLETFLDSIGEWGNYQFYADVFRALGPDVASLPLSSLITRQISSLAPGAEWGVEPKGARPPAKAVPLSTDAISQWASVMSENGVSLSVEDANYLLAKSPLRLNALTLFSWLKTRGFIQDERDRRV